MIERAKFYGGGGNAAVDIQDIATLTTSTFYGGGRGGGGAISIPLGLVLGSGARAPAEQIQYGGGRTQMDEPVYISEKVLDEPMFDNLIRLVSPDSKRPKTRRMKIKMRNSKPTR
jgi:hypothetical protein